MSVVLSLVVHGLPAPQGSKTRTQWGVREDNRRTKPWRQTVAAAVAEKMNGSGPIVGPAQIEARFCFPRPLDHFGTGRNAGVVKASAPYWKATAPDVTKLMRAIEDGMVEGGAFRNDAQIVKTIASKVWGHPARVEIIVSTMDRP